MKSWFLFLVTVFIVLALGALILMLRRPYVQHASKPIVTSKPLVLPSATAPSPSQPSSDKPEISAPLPNSKVGSPLVIKGVVPSGWMFEGVFPIKLLDGKRNVIATAQGREVTPGSWNSGKNVEFSATISFSTTDKTGVIVLEKDNPSGLPQNAGFFEIPVTF